MPNAFSGIRILNFISMIFFVNNEEIVTVSSASDCDIKDYAEIDTLEISEHDKMYETLVNVRTKQSKNSIPQQTLFLNHPHGISSLPTFYILF